MQPGVLSSVLLSRVPVPQGLCARAGTLPPAGVSTQPVRGALHGTVGRSCGRKEQSPAGQGRTGQDLSAVKRVLRGAGLLAPPDHPQDVPEGTFQEEGLCDGNLKVKESVL